MVFLFNFIGFSFFTLLIFSTKDLANIVEDESNTKLVERLTIRRVESVKIIKKRKWFDVK